MASPPLASHLQGLVALNELEMASAVAKVSPLPGGVTTDKTDLIILNITSCNLILLMDIHHAFILGILSADKR